MASHSSSLFIRGPAYRPFTCFKVIDWRLAIQAVQALVTIEDFKQFLERYGI